MAQQILSTNTFGVAKWIVSATASDGTHTTIASALTSASSGDTIFIRPGTYTENLTLKAGVNLTAFSGDAFTPNVTIIGTCTLTTAGTVSISGIRLQTNSAALLALTGSAASVVNLVDCYLNITNNTGISFTTSGASSGINIINCRGDIGTTGITLCTQSAPGQITILYSTITNSGNSSTASTFSAGGFSAQWSFLYFPISTSSTAGMSLIHTLVDTGATNTTSVALSGTAGGDFRYAELASGTATPLTVGLNVVLFAPYFSLNHTNATAISGLGTLHYGVLNQIMTAGALTVSVVAPFTTDIGSLALSTALPVASGGTGDASFTAYSVVTGGTTATGALQNVSGVGTSGQVLTSNGAGALPTWQAAGGGGLSVATVTLTSAQIKALHATPIQIVANPGAGKMIVVVNSVGKYIYGGTNVFVAGASQTISLTYGTGTSVITAAISNGQLTGTTTSFNQALPTNTIVGVAATLVENLALNLYNSVATEISGNAAGNNTAQIDVLYYIDTI